MTLRAIRILRLDLTVSDLACAEAFYTSALGFTRQGAADLPPDMAALLGAESVREVRLARDGQNLSLQSFRPAGLPYPPNATACDQRFQHFAVPVAEIGAARLPEATPPISRGGAQRLPARAGGVTAFKFRDPDGHPLELIQFPDGKLGGIDHTAIVVADAARSVAFYRDQLGFTLAASQINTGPEQDRLDGLDHVTVDVIALEPERPTPHLELLAYRHPPVAMAAPLRPADIAATRLVLEVQGLDRPAALIEDPDGHKLLLLPQSGHLVSLPD